MIRNTLYRVEGIIRRMVSHGFRFIVLLVIMKIISLQIETELNAGNLLDWLTGTDGSITITNGVITAIQQAT